VPLRSSKREKRLAAQRPDAIAAARPGDGPPREAASDGERRLVVVAISHLDTQWQWTLRDTIQRFLPQTVRENAARFAEFPSHVLSFDGAFRYRLLGEYYPDLLAEVKRWMAAGRWAVAGAFLDAVDVNLPAPESLVRHVLYANDWFERELGLRAADVFLPDCFGFSHALPSIAAHCGLELFSSQKLTRDRGAVPLPFDIGLWEGPDGATVVAAINPGGYGEPLSIDLATDPAWSAAIDRVAASGGPPVALKYFGIGDTGGAPDRASLRRLEQAVHARGAQRVVPGPPARLLEEIPPAAREGLPRHRGELLMAEHGSGCYTAQAAMKRWNRRNEQLADAAERAAVAAAWLGAATYPRERLAEAWQRFLVHQFHDDLTGTSVPAAYRYSWNDEVLSLNQFAAVLRDSVGAVASGLDTEVAGAPLVVFNPLAWEREDVIEAVIRLPGEAPAALRVLAPDGGEVPAQFRRLADGRFELVFVARLAGCSFTVFDVRRAETAPGGLDRLRAEPGRLVGAGLEAGFDAAGDLVSLRLGAGTRELLAGAARLELLPDRSLRFPAWEIRHEDLRAAPLASFSPAPEIRVIEAGPARVGFEVERRVGRSTLRARYRLAAGAAGDHLECELTLDWRERGRLLKAAFPFDLPAARATYDLGLGTIERGVNSPRRYEVPAQQWADLSDAEQGVAILSDSRQGWDRPGPGTLRLTLVHTPALGRRFRYQRGLDVGIHRLRFGVAPHRGGWVAARVPWIAARFNQPPIAFQASRHAGRLGRQFQLLGLADPAVAIRALKLAERSDEWVVRFQELHGAPAVDVGPRIAPALVSVREVDGQERERGPALLRADGSLAIHLGAYQPRAFALRTAPPREALAPLRQRALALQFDARATSAQGERTSAGLDGRGRSIPAELWPPALELGAVRFTLGPGGGPNVLRCSGQRWRLDDCAGASLHLLLAATGGDRRAVFKVAGQRIELEVQDWAEPIGQWQRRRWSRRLPGFVKRAEVAWVGTHRHRRGADEVYEACYLFRHVLPAPLAGPAEVVLPDDARVCLFAACLVWDAERAIETASVLYD